MDKALASKVIYLTYAEAMQVRILVPISEKFPSMKVFVSGPFQGLQGSNITHKKYQPWSFNFNFSPLKKEGWKVMKILKLYYSGNFSIQIVEACMYYANVWLDGSSGSKKIVLFSSAMPGDM